MKPLDPRSLAMTILLAAVVALGPLSTDMYLASLPSIREDLGATVAEVQLTLSVYLVGIAGCQLLYGPLSDRFGRRPVLLVGLIVYAVAGLACALAWSIEALVLFRLLQAVGACSGQVIGRAIVRDYFEREEAARKLSYIGTAMGLAPAVAPVIGGYLTVWFGWTANFYFLGIYGAAAAAFVYFKLEESNVAMDPTALRPRQLAQNYLAVLSHRRYLGYTFMSAFCYAGLFSFISASPLVLIEHYGVPTDNFGYFFGMIVLGYIAGTVFAGRYGMRFGVDGMLAFGGVIAITAGGSMALLALGGVDRIGAVMAPMVCYMVSLGIVLPQGMAGALSYFPTRAGVASAALGFVQMSFAAAAGTVLGYVHDGTQVPMALSIGLMGLITMSIYLTMIRRGASPAPG